MDFLQAIILAIVEGLTEFLPVSSTAHMIFTSAIFKTEGDAFVKLFQVSIQFGAILSVVVLYWKKFINFQSFSFYLKLAIAVIPALVLGKLFDDKIEAVLGNQIAISSVLVLGGVILLFADKWFKNPKIDDEKGITIRKAITIGFWQCLAMMPGTSRSAASIIGGMTQGLTRKAAAEFSFFLAVPTMAAATGYKLLKGYKQISTADLQLFAIGNAVAFVVSLLAIQFFIRFVQRNGFRVFAFYRIVVGTILLILLATGYLKA